MAELHVLTIEGEETVVPLGDAEVTFGRADECDLVLAEERASRRHCTFKPVRSGWRVVDLGSSNGTFLGERPVLSARLQPGDELVIGKTLIRFESEAIAPAERPRRAIGRKTPWGLLALPVILGAVAVLGIGMISDSNDGTVRDAWTRFVRAEMARADLPGMTEQRDDILRATAAALPEETIADQARRVLATAAPTSATPTSADDSAWRAAVQGIADSWPHTTDSEKRRRLLEVADRHIDDAGATGEIRELFAKLRTEAGARLGADRERAFTEADRAVAEGRFGEALDAWNGWLLRTPLVTREDERALAKRLATARAGARDAAATILAQVEVLETEGRSDAARELADRGRERLRGTGYDAWLAARTTRFDPSADVRITDLPGTGDATTRERTTALRGLAGAEELARIRRFGDAIVRLEETLEAIKEEALRTDLQNRLIDLRREESILEKLIAAVRKSPRDFSPLKLDGDNWRVNGATDDTILLERNKKFAPRPISDLPADAFGQLVRRAKFTDLEDAYSAALLLFDVGDQPGYTDMMRLALSAELDDDRLGYSLAHARLHGWPMPDGGYVPHPTVKTEIIDWDAYRAIKNAEKIAEFNARLESLTKKVETSKQAKGIARVAKAYAALEKARDHALDLIFDEEQYFYPYRDRMAEYTPVSNEVNDRVELVREAWASKAKASPKLDKMMERLIDEAEDLRIEIDYLGGDADPMWLRIEAVTRYLDRDLTVQRFFVTEADLAQIEYNDGVMAANAVADSVATDPERRQVEVTNEYRIMFGHRRAVIINDQLTLSSRGHSEDMSKGGFFDHFSPVPGKRSPGDRIALAGYQFVGCSENIHMGSGSPEGAHSSWIHSSGHHRNILTPSWVEMGTGQYGRHWTQNFGFKN